MLIGQRAIRVRVRHRRFVVLDRLDRTPAVREASYWRPRPHCIDLTGAEAPPAAAVIAPARYRAAYRSRSRRSRRRPRQLGRTTEGLTGQYSAIWIAPASLRAASSVMDAGRSPPAELSMTLTSSNGGRPRDIPR